MITSLLSNLLGLSPCSPQCRNGVKIQDLRKGGLPSWLVLSLALGVRALKGRDIQRAQHTPDESIIQAKASTIMELSVDVPIDQTVMVQAVQLQCQSRGSCCCCHRTPGLGSWDQVYTARTSLNPYPRCLYACGETETPAGGPDACVKSIQGLLPFVMLAATKSCTTSCHRASCGAWRPVGYRDLDALL